MNQKARAVICRALDQPVVVEDIVVEAPRRNEVMIKLAACGVCHSDLSATNGTIPFPPPLVLGHEGAGTVVQVGEGVTEFALGDAAIGSFVSMCGKCRYCATGRPQLCDQAAKAMFTLPDGSVRTRDAAGLPLNDFSGCGVMAEYATLHVDNLVKIGHDVPLDRCALVGCAVMTGVGAACNTAQRRAGFDRRRVRRRRRRAERDPGLRAQRRGDDRRRRHQRCQARLGARVRRHAHAERDRRGERRSRTAQDHRRRRRRARSSASATARCWRRPTARCARAARP